MKQTFTVITTNKNYILVRAASSIEATLIGNWVIKHVINKGMIATPEMIQKLTLNSKKN